MTNSEAIQILKDMLECRYITYLTNESRDAIQKGIEALEKQVREEPQKASQHQMIVETRDNEPRLCSDERWLNYLPFGI